MNWRPFSMMVSVSVFCGCEWSRGMDACQCMAAKYIKSRCSGECVVKEREQDPPPCMQATRQQHALNWQNHAECTVRCTKSKETLSSGVIIERKGAGG